MIIFIGELWQLNIIRWRGDALFHFIVRQIFFCPSPATSSFLAAKFTLKNTRFLCKRTINKYNEILSRNIFSWIMVHELHLYWLFVASSVCLVFECYKFLCAFWWHRFGNRLFEHFRQDLHFTNMLFVICFDFDWFLVVFSKNGMQCNAMQVQVQVQVPVQVQVQMEMVCRMSGKCNLNGWIYICHQMSKLFSISGSRSTTEILCNKRKLNAWYHIKTYKERTTNYSIYVCHRKW